MAKSTCDILPEIPDPEHIRRRLAVVLTEADVLRAQLRVSARGQRERERLAAVLTKRARSIPPHNATPPERTEVDRAS